MKRNCSSFKPGSSGLFAFKLSHFETKAKVFSIPADKSIAMIYLLFSFFMTFSAEARVGGPHVPHGPDLTVKVKLDSIKDKQLAISDRVNSNHKLLKEIGQTVDHNRKHINAIKEIGQTVDHNRKHINAILDKLNQCQACKASSCPVATTSQTAESTGPGTGGWTGAGGWTSTGERWTTGKGGSTGQR